MDIGYIEEMRCMSRTGIIFIVLKRNLDLILELKQSVFYVVLSSCII